MCHCFKTITPSFLGHPLSLFPPISASYALLTNLSGPIPTKASLNLMQFAPSDLL